MRPWNRSSWLPHQGLSRGKRVSQQRTEATEGPGLWPPLGSSSHFKAPQGQGWLGKEFI